MTWREVDLAAKIWVIPATRMKAGRPHRVPLSDAAMSILESVLPLKTGDDSLVFPGFARNTVKPLSDVAVAKHLTSGTAHGLRSTFRDWCSECTTVQREVIELCLAHSVGNAVEQAYARSDLLDKRRALMQQWADYLTANTIEKTHDNE